MKQPLVSPLISTILLSSILGSPASSAPGDLDKTFIPPNLSDVVYDTIVQADGRIIVGGNFTNVGSESARDRLIRLMPNGALDSSFSAPANMNGPVSHLALLSDGKILVAGAFDDAGGVTDLNNLIRLFPGGELDTGFTPPSALNSEVRIVVEMADGKLLVGGFFTDVGGIESRDYLIRLLPNGVLDTDFNPPAGLVAPVLSITLEPNGKILIGSSEEFSDLADLGPFMRLLPDGGLDNTFTAPADLWGSIYDSIVQTDGKIVIGGAVHLYTRSYLMRLLPDGSLDTEFLNPGISNVAQSMIQQPDGKILVGGNIRPEFDTFYLFRMFPDGTFDSTFQPPAFLDLWVGSLTLQPDGKLLTAGFFQDVDGDSDHDFLARIEAFETAIPTVPLVSNPPSVSDAALKKKVKKLKKKIKAAKKKGKKAKAKKLIKLLKQLE